MKYSYLLAATLLFPVWLLVFFRRPDLRRPLWLMSFLIAIYGVIGEYFLWTRGWWNPITITGTRVGIEDFIYGFFGGGLLGAFYEYLFNRQIVRKSRVNGNLVRFASFLYILSFVISFVLFYLVGFSSFHASIVGLIVPTLLIFLKRRDLILSSFLIGTFFMLFSFPQFWFLFWLDPSAILWWDFTQIPDIRILMAPLADLIWYFFSGLFMGVFYEVLEDSRIVSR